MMVEHCDFKVQGDIPNAFLIPMINVDIYMELPEGYVGDRSKVCKLLKGLYGTKQASWLFYYEISDFLRNDLGMLRSEVNPCLFTLTVPDSIVITLMYVDDIIIGVDRQTDHYWVVTQIQCSMEQSDRIIPWYPMRGK